MNQETVAGNDVDNLALVAWKEARGEIAIAGLNSIRAVMHVINNRVGSPGFAHTLHDVIYGRNQFTSMSVPLDPEFNLQPKEGDATYMQCIKMARAILEGTDQDNTGGAHYYANLRNVRSGWFLTHIVSDQVNHPLTVLIGHHSFFK